MVRKTVKVHLEDGFDARPVALLVQVASQYECSVHLDTGEKKVNAKSIMGMMSIGPNVGEEITVICEGSDEEAAALAVENFLLGKAS